MQAKLLRLFHYSLHTGGCLFLGSAETVGHVSDQFAALDAKWRLYRSRLAPARAEPAGFPPSLATHPPGIPPCQPSRNRCRTSNRSTEQLLLRSYTPLPSSVDAAGDILYVSGHTGRYLEPAAGRANWNLFAMARDGLGHDLGSAFRQLQRKGRLPPSS